MFGIFENEGEGGMKKSPASLTAVGTRCKRIASAREPPKRDPTLPLNRGEELASAVRGVAMAIVWLRTRERW